MSDPKIKIDGLDWNGIIDVRIDPASEAPSSEPTTVTGRFTLRLLMDDELLELRDKVVETLTPYEHCEVPPQVLAFCQGLWSAKERGELFAEEQGVIGNTPTLRFVPSPLYRALVEDLVAVAKRFPPATHRGST